MITDLSEVEIRAMERSYLTATHATCGGDLGMWTSGPAELQAIINAAEEHVCEGETE